jgi:hypothetical protein
LVHCSTTPRSNSGGSDDGDAISRSEPWCFLPSIQGQSLVKR